MIDVRRPFPESHEPLRHLTNVPVDELYVEPLKMVLETHGARFTLTELRRYPPDGPNRTYFLYTIDFPEGTYRSYGMQLLRKAPFTIVFPDGFTQPGADLYRFLAHPDLPQDPITCLYLVK